MKYDYVVVEGNIGTGKTSLATRLSETYGTRLVLERFAENPFLPPFYENPQRFAFPLELSFLADRYQQLKEELTPQELFHTQTVSDYILSKSLIFAGITLKDDEFGLYQRLFQIINPHLPKPQLLVYLHKSVDNLRRNIRSRGREYEQKIQPEYLERLEKGYWTYFRQLEGVRILVIDTNNIDFMKNNEDFELLLQLLNKDYEPGIHRLLTR
ncbi:MAG: deoxynucleoside kinase [Bacteroidia bacterium]|nr:deoxynucleoside kinase [Bacteroidia bacterium]